MSNTIRAKFVCTSVTEHANNSNKTIKLTAQYDMNIPEDRRFQKATPYGEFKVVVSNPAAVERLAVLGKAFYLDLTPCEDEAKSSLVDQPGASFEGSLQ